MKTRIVCWAKKQDQKRALMAIQLLEEKSMVESFAFPQEVVTEEFENQLRNTWKKGESILFPEHQSFQFKLTVTDPLIPEEYTLEDEDLINRMRTEWNFVVLSHRLKTTFQEELEELASDIDQITDFDSTLWNNLKEFWSKVQTQARDKNLFRHHADDIRDKTNSLFDKMKSIRRKANKELEEDSKKYKAKFMDQLEKIEEKVEKNLSLHPIFEELKDIQRKFKGTRFTRADQNEVWEKLDGLFKEIKSRRFGKSSGGSSAQPSHRVQRRLDGLLGAIDRMTRSIKRDEKELLYEQNKPGDAGNQLENQLRGAKMNMIRQRIESKNAKLEDMNKTKDQLERKMARLKQKEEEEKAKKEIKQQIAKDIKSHHDHVKEDPKLSKAIEEIKPEDTSEETPSPENKSFESPIELFITGLGKVDFL